MAASKAISRQCAVRMGRWFCILAVAVLAGCATMDSMVGTFVRTSADTAYSEGRYQEAAVDYRKAAEAGDARAQFMLGHMYDQGQGVPQSTQESVHWMEMAAGNGYTTAQVIMGVRYLSGDGVTANIPKAFHLFNTAAQAEDEMAYFYLGLLYDAGIGVPRDPAQAEHYYRLARANGMSVPDNPMAEVAATRERLAHSPGGGSKGADREGLVREKMVRDAQDSLTRLGYNPGPVDGVYGEKTKHAIMLFQKNVGLEVDGRVSPQLLEKIHARLQ